jgi:hypothetical protein
VFVTKPTISRASLIPKAVSRCNDAFAGIRSFRFQSSCRSSSPVQTIMFVSLSAYWCAFPRALISRHA